MKTIKYPWDWRVMLLGCVGLALSLGIAFFGSSLPYSQLWDVIFIFPTVLLFLTLNFTIGTYGLIDQENKTLSRTDYFFYTQRLNIKDIHTIYYRPTWIVGGFTRSLYIVGNVNGKEKIIEFPNVGWYEPVLPEIAKNLKKLNPSIEFAEDTQVLIRKYEKN